MSEALAKLTPDAHMRTLKAKRADEGDTLLTAARRVIAFKTLKVVSLEWERPEASISHQYRGEKGSYARLTDLPDLIRWAPDRELADTLLRPSGLMAVTIPELTDRDLVLGMMRVAAQYFGQKAMESFLGDSNREALAEAAKRRGGG